MQHYSTWSVHKATGNYLRLRPASDMIDLLSGSSVEKLLHEGVKDWGSNPSRSTSN